MTAITYKNTDLGKHVQSGFTKRNIAHNIWNGHNPTLIEVTVFDG